MIARPSRPSVRFTALLVPTITKNVSAMKPNTPSGYDDRLEERHDQVGARGSTMLNPLCIHVENSCTNCALSGAETENAR